MPEADSETTLARRGSGMVRLPDLRGGQERDGWGSSWRQPASPQRVSLGSGGVTLLASTSATPELRPAFEPCRIIQQIPDARACRNVSWIKCFKKPRLQRTFTVRSRQDR